MIKKVVIFAGLFTLAAGAYATDYTVSGYVGNWASNATLSALTSVDHVRFTNNCNVSISSEISGGARITVGQSNSGGVLSLTGTGKYVSTASMVFGLGVGGSGQLNIAYGGDFRTSGATYIGQNGATGTASIAGILSTSNTIWVGRSESTYSSIGAVTVTSGILSTTNTLNIAGYTNAAVTSSTSMTGYVDLRGGRLNVNSIVMGNAAAKVSDANLMISSAMLSANITGAFTMNAASHLTLSAAASTDWSTKGAILAIGGTFSISNTSTIVLNLNDFDGWDNMKSGDKITMTVATYGSIVTSGTPSISAVGLSEDFTLGAFNVGATAATVDITYNPIPEPAMAAGLLGGAVLFLAVRRRRKL